MRVGHATLSLLAAFGSACHQSPSHPTVPDAGTLPSYSIITQSLPDGRQGMSYAETIDTIGDPPADLRWSIAAGSLPQGMVLNVAGPAALRSEERPHRPAPSLSPLPPMDHPAGISTAAFSLQIRPPLSIVGDLTEGGGQHGWSRQQRNQPCIFTVGATR